MNKKASIICGILGVAVIGDCIVENSRKDDAYEMHREETLTQLDSVSDNYSPDFARRLLEQCETINDDSITKAAEDKLLSHFENAVSVDDSLMRGNCMFPVYAKWGDRLHISISTEDKATISLFNANSHQLQNQFATNHVDTIVYIPHDAVYLLEIDAGQQQYGNVEMSVKHKDINSIKNPMVVKTKTVNCQPGDFLAKKIEGIKMKNAFNEVRKFTLRGNIKAWFSGAKRALVPIQVTDGATDILYSLTISTNEGAGSDDKDDFYNHMSESYTKVKILGLPIYERRGSTVLGLLSTMLGMNQPVRDEDAYLNMYVFFNAAQARKFQNGAPAEKLKYSLDYSTLGTQSCNGRIPCKGRTTVYLGFENERMRYNNYVWVSALLSVPHTEYVRNEYYAVPENEQY